jgi:outer membrane protein TolC
MDLRTGRVGEKLGWALLGPHLSLGLDFSFLGGESSFNSSSMSSGGGMDMAQIAALCQQAQDSAACLLWMQQNAEYTGLLLGQVMSGFGRIGDVFMADTVKFSLGFAWPVVSWSSLLNVRRMKLISRVSRASHGNTTQDVVTNVTLAYYGVLAAEEAAEIVRETAKATKEHLRQAKALKAGGLGTQVDILRWQAKEADDEQQILQADQRVASAKFGLNNLLGRRLDAPLRLEIPATISNEELPEPAGRAEPLKSHPQLRLTRLNMQMKDVDYKTSQASFLPSVTLSGGYTWQRFLPHEDIGANADWLGSWAVMLSIKVPIFDSMTKVYDLQMKELAASKARLEARNAERFLRQQVLSADLEVQSAHKKISVAKKQVKLATEAHKSAENLYEAGEAKTTDVLDAQNGLVLARLNLLSARYSYLMALAQRARAVGEVR